MHHVLPHTQDSQIQSERYSRHGWGDTSLLKVDGYAGVAHPRGELTPEGGKARTQSPRGKDGRNGLFGVLQQTEAGGADSWIGNGLIDPTKGKRPAAPSFDPKGRKDLFDVLHGRNPGVPADDSWLGHKLIDPAKVCAQTASQQAAVVHRQQPSLRRLCAFIIRMCAFIGAGAADHWMTIR